MFGHGSGVRERNQRIKRVYIYRVRQDRIYPPYMTFYTIESLQKTPWMHRIYMVLANPRYIVHSNKTVPTTFGHGLGVKDRSMRNKRGQQQNSVHHAH